MRLANMLVVVVAALLVGGGYLQERQRLRTVKALPAERARLLFETAERRRERTMIVVTIVLGLAAAASLVARWL
jgi:hypothetical protein